MSGIRLEELSQKKHNPHGPAPRLRSKKMIIPESGLMGNKSDGCSKYGFRLKSKNALLL
jgi:hypothetical protein